jgi:hypothetical protein
VSKVTGLHPEPLMHILNHLRAIDREEIEAVRGVTFNPLTMTMELCHVAEHTGEGWIFWRTDTGEPVACLGAYAMTPKVAVCWAFGTDSWDHVVRGMTRHARRVMVPALLQAGFHRAECRALAKREDTKLWLGSLGWKQEAALSEFGIRHEEFTLFAWLASEQADHSGQSRQTGELPLRGRQ